MAGQPSTTRYAVAEEATYRCTTALTRNAQIIIRYSFAQSAALRMKSTDHINVSKLRISLTSIFKNGKNFFFFNPIRILKNRALIN